MSGALLTLDLSSTIGWTCGHPSDRNFAFGTYALPKTGELLGPFAQAYDQWLRGVIRMHEVSLVVFEAPILPQRTMLATVRKLSGLCWHTEFVCGLLGVECLEAHQQNVKKYVTGNGMAKKQQMFEAIRAYGYGVKTFDESDAVGVRLFVLSERFPDAAYVLNLEMGPLGRSAERRQSCR